MSNKTHNKPNKTQIPIKPLTPDLGLLRNKKSVFEPCEKLSRAYTQNSAVVQLQ